MLDNCKNKLEQRLVVRRVWKQNWKDEKDKEEMNNK